MTKNYAIIQDGIVSSVVVWDGQAVWNPPQETQAVLIPDEQQRIVSIGYLYVDGAFVNPAPPAPEQEAEQS